MQMGYSHLLRIFAYKLELKFNTKTSILLFGLNKNDFLFISHNIKKKRPHNIFTGKGIRFARQIIYKKAGKVSSYR
jgi:ribosomal protein L6P/L9E